MTGKRWGAFLVNSAQVMQAEMANSSDDTNATAQIAKRVILKTTECEIPLTPENYKLWFIYFAGGDKDLTAHLDEILASGKSFDQEMNARLYEKYFGEEKGKKLMEEIQSESRKILKNMLQEILTTNNFTSAYSDKLQEYSLKLEAAEGPSHIKEIVGNIVKDTHAMAASSARLEKNLEEATRHTEKLKQRLEKTEKETLIDALTGLHNRKAFDRKLNDLYAEYIETGTAFSIVMLDIDFFKKFNDNYGHKIGDGVLEKVGITLYECLKGRDFPVRYGGEEFIVLLPNTILDNACIVAEQIRQQISEKRIKLVKTGEDLGNITVSLGVSEITAGDSTDTVVERADKALYLAKDSGRNNFKSQKDLHSPETNPYLTLHQPA